MPTLCPRFTTTVNHDSSYAAAKVLVQRKSLQQAAEKSRQQEQSAAPECGGCPLVCCIPTSLGNKRNPGWPHAAPEVAAHMRVFRFLDTGRRPENGLGAVVLGLQRSAAGGGGAAAALQEQQRVRVGGAQSGTACLCCVVECVVLYVEYLSVAVFLQSITGSSPHASECVGAAGCAVHIISGAVAYAVAVAYFILRYTAFFGEGSYHTVIDGIGFGRHALRMGRAPLLVLIAHVLGNMLSAFFLLPAGSASAGRLVAAPGTTVRTVLLSPLLEELIFRGLIPAVIHNRCRSPRPFTANAMFSVIHMWNLLGTGQKFEVVVLQCVMAFVLGFYYATRHTSAGGSLWECIALHSTNNLLAVVFDATHEQVGSTALIAGVVLTAGLYGMATLGEWYHGQHSTATATNAD